MDTVQIQHALQDVNSFLGVYASDLLPLSIAQTGTIIVNTDPHRAWLTLASHIFSKPSSHLKRLLLRFLLPLSFYSLHLRFYTTPLYSLAINRTQFQGPTNSLWRILLPLRSVHGQGLHPQKFVGLFPAENADRNIHQLFCSEFGATLCTQRSGGQCCTNLYKR